MKRLYRTFKFTAIALLAISLSNCTGELTTNSSTDVDESTILSSTTGLNMSLTGTYKYLLLGESGASSQNDACYAGVTGLCMGYDLLGADILSTKNYGGSVEDHYRFSEGRTQSAGDYAKRIWTNILKLAHIRMDFAGIMQTIGIKGRYVGFTYIRPLYGFAPFWRS